jgi:hypothetical protein
MLKFIFLIFSIGFYYDGMSQNISLDQFISLRNRTLDYVDNFLTSRNWELNSSKESTDTSTSSVNYIYVNKPGQKENYSAITFYHFNTLPLFNRIFIQFDNVNFYNSYVKRLVQLGFIKEKISVGDNEIKMIYRKNTTTIEVASITNGEYPNKFNLYSFFICHTRDYNNNFIL